MSRRYRLAGALAICVLLVTLLVAGLHPRTTTGTALPRPGVALARPGTCGPLLASMDVRHRVAQLVVVGVNAADPPAAVKLVHDEQIGGIFIGGNATELLENHALDAVRDAADLPLSVAVDEEGGRVQRIDDLDGSLPSARELAATKTPDEVHALAAERGRQLRARGVTVDFAPDTDVTDAADDTVIGDRSFSPDPARVKTYAAAFAAGLRDAGVQPVLKHFPGHGHASGDSHKGLVRTPPLAQLRTLDLVPYRDLADYGPVDVMVGHLDVPDLTNGAAASLSAPVYQLLRGEYGFTGPILTDDLGAMRAITEQYSLPDAVLKALQAGADQALWSSGGRTDEVLDRLVRAVGSGELPESRVQESATRVLAAKNACA